MVEESSPPLSQTPSGNVRDQVLANRLLQQIDPALPWLGIERLRQRGNFVSCQYGECHVAIAPFAVTCPGRSFSMPSTSVYGAGTQLRRR